MKKILSVLFMLAAAFVLTGCGERVNVPPASKGIVLGPNGYKGDVLPPSQFRLDPCLFVCDKLVVIEAGDTSITEKMEVLMPKDRLMLGVTVRFTAGMSDNDDEIRVAMSRITPAKLDSGNYGSTLQTVYEIYGAPIIQNVVRSVLSRYTIEEISANQAEISEKLRQEVVSSLAKTPLKVSQFGLTDINYPGPVLEAMNQSAQRKVDIERAESDYQVKMREAKSRFEVAKQDREADILMAKTMRETHEILSTGVTPEVMRFRELQVMEKMADNKNAVFFPVDMTGSVGLNNRLFSK